MAYGESGVNIILWLTTTIACCTNGASTGGLHMTMPTLTIEQAIALCGVLNGNCSTPATAETPKQVIGKIGRPVIVRSRDAGVLFGEYQGSDGANIQLKNAVQMWSWTAAKGGTLLDCAIYGVIPSKCKFSVASTASVTVFNACAMIDCSEDGSSSIRKVEGGPWK